MQRIVVVGAGVAGSSLTFRLAQAGQAVTLIDRAEPSWGTTGSSFAWTNANTKTPEDYFALNVAGMQAWRDLRDELGAAPWLGEGGNLAWVTGEDDAAKLEARVARLRSWGYPAEWLSRDDAAALEPNLRLEDEVEQAAYFPTESWIDGPAFARAMTDEARQHGAETRFASQVVAVERDGGRVSGVRLADGERIDADLVINCAGPGADVVARMAGRDLPLAPTRGLIVRASHAADQVGRVVHAPSVHLRPDGDLLMLHHGDADAGIERGDPPAGWAAELLRRAVEYLPALEAARVSRWSIGTRPIPADGRTSAGLVSSTPGYAEVVTHSAITLGPLLATLVTRQIVAGQTDLLLAPFSPDRFG